MTVEARPAGLCDPRLQIRDMIQRNVPCGRTYSGSRINPPGLTTRPSSRSAGTWRSFGNAQNRKVVQRHRRSGRKLQIGHVHLVQPPARSESQASLLRAFEYSGAGIDLGNNSVGRIVGSVPTRPDTCVEQLTVEVLDHQRSQATVSLRLEWRIEEVVERGNPLVSSQILCRRGG